jgi:serine/threonine-protein kinase
MDDATQHANYRHPTKRRNKPMKTLNTSKITKLALIAMPCDRPLGRDTNSPTSTVTPRLGRHRRNALIGALILLAVSALAITGCGRTAPSLPATSQASQSPGPTAKPAPRQTLLPFTGLTNPQSVAVDAAGNIYVVDYASGYHGAPGHVVRLSAGSSTQTVLPFTDIGRPGSIAVDTAGNVYLTANHQVLRLAAGSNTQTVLPFTGLHNPGGLAVDTAGNVYVVDHESDTNPGVNRLVELAAGSNTQTALAFTGLEDPTGVVVDAAGSMYVLDFGTGGIDARVVKLAPGSSTQTVLPFSDLGKPWALAVDVAGNLYVADNGQGGPSRPRVVELVAGSNTQTVLPFTGLDGANGVAVDTADAVYVTDNINHRVLKLTASGL